MNYYEFVNSRDIRKYLEDIKYNFSPLEKAYIAYQSNHHTIKEIFEAFQDIIDNESDCKIKKRFNCISFSSLKNFLKKYMELFVKLTNRFYKNERNCIYKAEFLNKGDNDFFESDFISSDFSTMKAFLEDDLKDNEVKVIRIKKQFLNKERSYIEIDFNKKMEIVNFSRLSTGIFSRKEEDVLAAFDGMWFDIPTPFKKGDLLTFCERPYWTDCLSFGVDNAPFVLQYLPTWSYNKYLKDGFLDNEPISKDNWNHILKRHKQNGDDTDMYVVAYYCSVNYFFPESDGCYLNAEYYRGKIVGRARIMLALSKYIKGEIDLYGLQKAIQVIVKQEDAKDELTYFHYTDEELKKLKIIDD